MKSIFSNLSEFWSIFWHDTPVFDKAIIFSGAAASPALTFSHITAIIGWLVGVATIVFTVLRIMVTVDELKERKRRRVKDSDR